MLTALFRYSDPYINTASWRRPLNIYTSGYDLPPPESVPPSPTLRSHYSVAACAFLPDTLSLLLSFMDPLEALEAHAVHIGGPHVLVGLSRIGFTWKGDSPRVRSSTFHLSAKLLGILKDIYGDFDPESEGHWLGCLLMPRRRPLVPTTYTCPPALHLLIDLGVTSWQTTAPTPSNSSHETNSSRSFRPDTQWAPSSH